MSANLMNQSKEIGVLRSIGVTKTRIKCLFFYEAFVLVLSSCTLGIFIGTFIGYTMKLQQTIILQGDFTFVFPELQMGVIFLASVVCAFFATWGPSSMVTRKEIAAIFRM